MLDISRAIRKVEKITGCALTVQCEDGDPTWIEVHDAETRRIFKQFLGPPSRQMASIKKLHEEIYHARAKEKHQLQGGMCAHCNKDLGNMGECDHIESRGRHGRDDRLFNLQILCPPFSGGCDFHRKKHGG